ncbi:unnamed protein product [Symbiodinium sp. CCMP2592]|nr:unnamed protein product [Symbiodinium sp. CCMP2592]
MAVAQSVLLILINESCPLVGFGLRTRPDLLRTEQAHNEFECLGNQKLASRHAPARGKDADEAAFDLDERCSEVERGVLGRTVICPQTAVGILIMFMMCHGVSGDASGHEVIGRVGLDVRAYEAAGDYIDNPTSSGSEEQDHDGDEVHCASGHATFTDVQEGLKTCNIDPDYALKETTCKSVNSEGDCLTSAEGGMPCCWRDAGFKDSAKCAKKGSDAIGLQTPPDSCAPTKAAKMDPMPVCKMLCVNQFISEAYAGLTTRIATGMAEGADLFVVVWCLALFVRGLLQIGYLQRMGEFFHVDGAPVDGLRDKLYSRTAELGTAYEDSLGKFNLQGFVGDTAIISAKSLLKSYGPF